MNKSFIDYTPNTLLNKTINSGLYVEWDVELIAEPEKYILWTNNNNQLIANISVSDGFGKSFRNNKYDVILSDFTNNVLFRINNVQRSDSGTYTIRLNNGFEEISFQFTLTVEARSLPPKVLVNGNSYHLLGTKSRINCSVFGFPLPTVKWFFKPCLDEFCPFEEKQVRY